jgi:hypothetical protein
MSGLEIVSLVERIDADIVENERRLQEEVAEYIEQHPDSIATEISRYGFAMVPTFAGEFRIDEKQLQEVTA